MNQKYLTACKVSVTIMIFSMFWDYTAWFILYLIENDSTSVNVTFIT